MDNTKSKNKVEKLREQQKKLIAKIQQAEAKDKKIEYKKDLRQKILIGAYHKEKAQNENSFADIVAIMDKYLKRDNDRKVFDLPPLEK